MVRKALKEWAVAVKALEAGRQVLLLRKGGLVEGSDGFSLEAKRFFLYPTRYHQMPTVVKPAFEDLVASAPADAPPEGFLRISLVADAEEVIPVTDRAGVQAVEGFHIWSASYMEDRFDWKPESPLFLIPLRVHRLAAVHDIPLLPSDGGCTSWVDLEAEISTEDATPVMEEEEFASRVEEIREALGVVRSKRLANS
jgi:hypothetical protein